MMDRKRILIVGIVTLFIVLLLAIYFLLYKTQKQEKIVQQPVKTKSFQTNVQEITFPTYSYDVQQLRDPFVPLILKREERKKGAFPLESYDIEELKLTGIAKDKKGSLALIQLPDGRFYIVRENDKIGLSGGKVSKILKDSVEIREDNRKLKYLKLRTEEEK